jgi:hypothetical protein
MTGEFLINFITNFNPEVGGITASETLVSNYRTTRCYNPENHGFCLFIILKDNGQIVTW